MRVSRSGAATRQFSIKLGGPPYERLAAEAEARRVPLQELVRSVVLPEWLRDEAGGAFTCPGCGGRVVSRRGP